MAGKFVLKQSSDLEITISEGKEFHSNMDHLRKKRELLYFKAWLLRVPVSLFGTRNFYVLISTRL